MNSTPTNGPPAPQADLAFERHLRAMNDALLVSSVRQHELAVQMEKANALVRESENRSRTPPPRPSAPARPARAA